jgi:lysozyme family protein
MAKFEDAVRVVLQHEGGFADNPNDPGGVTNYGISSRWLHSVGLPCSREDVLALTVERATELYREYWWDPQRFGDIADQTIATKCFDMAVNAGPRQANILLQRALAYLEKPVKVDGVIGLITLVAINSCDPAALLGELTRAYSHFYKGLVATRPDLSGFLAGWLKRAAWTA